MYMAEWFEYCDYLNYLDDMLYHRDQELLRQWQNLEDYYNA
jgi:hypothetical protein